MKPSIQTLKGFRDFLPAEKQARNYVQQKVVETFTQFGFVPLETPTLEYASLLLGKYGDEADKLVYNFTDRGGRDVALRYDQTVPTARVLAQYQHSLPKYFRRYQIQNVFRADKPQKGRYREFTQCDIDIFGTHSAIADAEILACSYMAFQNVGFSQVQLAINDRQTLFSTLKPFATPEVTVFSIIQSIDKLDKLPEASVIEELLSKGLPPAMAQQALQAIQTAQPSPNLTAIRDHAQKLGVPAQALVFTPTLARGLDYYTGMIFELIVPVKEFAVGSFGGGGRYDTLIKQLGGVDIPAVGVAFGFDRMVGAGIELGLIPGSIQQAPLLVCGAENNTTQACEVAYQLRQQGLQCEVYPASETLQKQLKYAHQHAYAWVILPGEENMPEKTVVLKNMASGQQQAVTVEEVKSLVLPGI